MLFPTLFFFFFHTTIPRMIQIAMLHREAFTLEEGGGPHVCHGQLAIPILALAREKLFQSKALNLR